MAPMIDQQTAQEAAQKTVEGFSLMQFLAVLLPPAVIGWVSGTLATSRKVAGIEAKLDQVAQQQNIIYAELIRRKD